MNKSTKEMSWNYPNEKDLNSMNLSVLADEIMEWGAANKGKIVNVNTYEYSIMKQCSKWTCRLHLS